MLLPPKVLLHLRPEGCEHIVRVHEDMDEGIDNTHKSSVTTWCETDSDPTTEWHHRMVVEMEKRNLAIFLSQYEEHGVQELEYLHEEVKVCAIGYLYDHEFNIINY